MEIARAQFFLSSRDAKSCITACEITGTGTLSLNAVTDALYRAYGIRHVEMPATPTRVWNTIREARSA